MIQDGTVQIGEVTLLKKNGLFTPTCVIVVCLCVVVLSDVSTSLSR